MNNFTPKQIQKAAQKLKAPEIEYIRQVRRGSYPFHSPLLNRLEALNILWQEGNQDSVVCTHFGVAVLNSFGNVA